MNQKRKKDCQCKRPWVVVRDAPPLTQKPWCLNTKTDHWPGNAEPRAPKILSSFERRGWSWTFKLAQKRSGVGGDGAGLRKLDSSSLRDVSQQQCNGHCPCDFAQARQLKWQLRSALVAGQWRGDTALTDTSIVLAAVFASLRSGFFGRYPRSSLHSFVPPPPPRP